MKNLCVNDITFVNKYVEPQSHYPMENNGRYHYGMLYTMQGTEIYTFPDKKIYACPNSVLIIPKGEAYSIDMKDKESIVITMDFETSDNISFTPFCIKTNKNDSINTLFAEALNISKNKTTANSALLKSIFYKIVAKLIMCESTYTNSNSLKKISDAVNYMNSHFYEPNFKIHQLSEIAGVSTRYFEQLFYQHFKVSPREYIMMQKIELAKELLKSEKNSVTDVAKAVGYNDIYHFSKIFKKKAGISPGK